MNGQFEKGNKAQSNESAHRKRIIKTLLEPHLPTAANKLISLLSNEDEKLGLAAAKEIIDRVCGKAEQAIDVSDESGTIAAAILQFVKKDAS